MVENIGVIGSINDFISCRNVVALGKAERVAEESVQPIAEFYASITCRYVVFLHGRRHSFLL